MSRVIQRASWGRERKRWLWCCLQCGLWCCFTFKLVRCYTYSENGHQLEGPWRNCLIWKVNTNVGWVFDFVTNLQFLSICEHAVTENLSWMDLLFEKQQPNHEWLYKCLLQVDRVEGEDALPQLYDPVTIAEYWRKCPGSVMTRIAQLLGVAGGFLSHIAWDIATKKNERGGIGPPFHTRCFEGLPFLAICLDFSSFISQDTQFTWKYSTSLCYIDNFLLFLKLFSLLKLEQHGGAWSVMKGAHITNLLKYGCWDSSDFESLLLVRETIKIVSPSFETFKRELLSFVSCISPLRFSHGGSILDFTSSAIET